MYGKPDKDIPRLDRYKPKLTTLLKVLKEGSLQDNDVSESSRIVICPNMESGTMSQRPEHSVMQALQNLSDSQVNDFLSGHAPLTLAIRLGEHLMFVQLQLSTVPSRTQMPPSATPAPGKILSPTAAPSSTDTTAAAAPPPAASPASASCSAFLPSINPVSLVEASRSLTEKLRELTRLSQEKIHTAGKPAAQPQPSSMPLTPPPSPPPSPGAVIDSMNHIGRGIYSGTFSGTLDPRLQDGSGRPKRDVSTILHILHDLLVAQPASHMTPTPLPHHHHSNYMPPSPTEKKEVAEHAVMRDKVQRIQMMLEERRQRRSARRENQRPYPRPSNLSGCTSFSHQSALIAGNKLLSGSIPSPSTPAASTTTTGAANHAENVETTNYRKPNMEQETVAV
ncbi:hypothetical protein C0Q70_16872 [Pomacea canaliculata]|uniref:Midnolin n=1 Tax=Pomacea canaliculata TaxID=400727 RepID=A0A2T7NR04_POMCA|nr:hypothetical protein C0Q70_16872 [Pomacea canaliculata]